MGILTIGRSIKKTFTRPTRQNFLPMGKAVVSIFLLLFLNLFVFHTESKAEKIISEGSISPKGKIQVFCNSPWTLVGIIEELRSLNIKIPIRLEEIENEICFKLNVPEFFDSGAFSSRLEEAIEIMNNLPSPGEKALVYRPPDFHQSRDFDPGFSPDRDELPVWETKEFLRDNVLAVGLKSYPYLVDFNLDGLTDLLVGDHDGFVHIYLNQGSNRMPEYHGFERLKSHSTGLDIALRLNPKLNFADLNGDGKTDLILGNYDGKPYMLPNQADEGYSFDDHKYTYFYTKKEEILDAGHYAYPKTVDWNLDGLFDLLVGEECGKVLLFRNGGTREEPKFTAEGEEIVNISPLMYPDPEFKDLNGDGKRDLILGNREGTILFYPNIGSDRFPRFAHFHCLECNGRKIDVGRLSHVFAGDWNADGILDLLVGNDDGEVRVFLGGERSGYEKETPFFVQEVLLRTKEASPLVAKTHPVFCRVDWNGDGKEDILAGGEGSELRFYPNTGTSASPRFADYRLVPEVKIESKTLTPAGTPASVYWDNPGLEFITEYLGNVSPEAVDWNGDGKIDLLAGNYAGLVYFYKNTGSANFPKLSRPIALKAGSRLLRVAGFSTPRAVDYNGDGLLDLLTGDLLGRVHIFLNIGSRSRPQLDKGRLLRVAGKDFFLGPRSIIEYGDLNGDGLKDIIIGNRFGGVYALLNRGTNESPEFDNVEPLKDRSQIWKTLYGGAWAGPFGNSMPLYWKKNTEVSNLNVVATSCPRLVFRTDRREPELWISNRFGLIFRFNPVSAEKQTGE